MHKRTFDSLEYFFSGEHPRILFLSGMHGNEYESGALVEEYLEKSAASLPDFLYIPKVSPSAVAKGTRRNQFGNDINRQFTAATTDPEALAIMSFLKTYTLTFTIDIHEDSDRSKSFYLYDSGNMEDEALVSYRAAIHEAGAILYSGIDDIDDQYLRRTIEKGYISFIPSDTQNDPGFSTFWLMRNGIVKRGFTMEIPGKAEKKLKQSLIANVIPFLVTQIDVQ